MNTQKTAQNALEDIKVSLKLKLATLWASLMFLIIYPDYFHLYFALLGFAYGVWPNDLIIRIQNGRNSFAPNGARYS